ncbi:hypothetical protein FOZ63_014852 [Perkinsus olseni]|uniref:Uncharacterized protein n=2 Tax=Perkinsus olseni TaxID=32597 RepID=A0A7J6RH29_PEROL|nr:hypothetical protein FOZ63_014852 [Perkinsus olseni]
MLVRWSPSPRASSVCRAVLSVRCCSTAFKGPSSGRVKEDDDSAEAATAGEPSEVEMVDPMRTRLSAVPKPESGIARRSVEEALLDERRKKYLQLYESTGTTRYLPPRDP